MYQHKYYINNYNSLNMLHNTFNRSVLLYNMKNIISLLHTIQSQWFNHELTKSKTNLSQQLMLTNVCAILILCAITVDIVHNVLVLNFATPILHLITRDYFTGGDFDPQLWVISLEKTNIPIKLCHIIGILQTDVVTIMHTPTVSDVDYDITCFNSSRMNCSDD